MRMQRACKWEYDVAIVGAGLTGAAIAQRLTEHGKRCLVLEKRPHIAGNAYDVEIDGIRVHRYGAHIFHTADRRIWEYVSRFADFNHYIHAPLANYRGSVYNLPFNMNTFSRLWGVADPQQAEQKLRAQRVVYDHEPRNLEEQALSLAGRDIYETLIRGYTEKQWGRPCAQLPAFLIRRLPFRFTYDNRYFSDPYQGIPEDGYTKLVERMLEGAELRLQTDYLQQRAYFDALAERIVFTGPIDAFFDYVEGRLEYRTLRFEDERLETPNYQGTAVMNFTDAETPYTRIIEHKHFLFGQQPNTIITKEYPMEWTPEAEPYYPINDAGNTAILKRYLERAKAQAKAYFCGRLGEYRYYDMDQAIGAGLALADRLLEQ